MFLIPCPEFNDIKKNKVSLILVFFMISVHLLIEFNQYQIKKIDFSEDKSASYLNIQAKLYQRHLSDLKSFKNADQRLIASVMDRDPVSSERLHSSISRVAALDNTFDPLSVSNVGLDMIEYSDWFDIHYMLKHNLKLSSAYQFGINEENFGRDRWLSYMFVHVGFFHLFSNVVFLLLFGALIETLLGGVVVCLVFFGSGFLAAPIYIYLNELNQISLVGASGGVCGLISFYAIYRFNEKIRFFYWVLPFENYFGFLSLSSIFVLFLWLISDLAGYFSGVAFFRQRCILSPPWWFFVGAMCAAGLRLYHYLLKSIFTHSFLNFDKINRT